MLGYTGRWKEAFVALGETPETVLAHLGSLPVNAASAVWSSFLLLGRPADARQSAAAILTSLSARHDELAVLVSQVNLGVLLMIPFLLDDRETRQRYEAELAAIIRRVDEARGAVPPLLNRCPLLIVTGEFAAAADSLRASLALADACAAPYERAFTVPALAEHAAACDELRRSPSAPETSSTPTPASAPSAATAAPPRRSCCCKVPPPSTRATTRSAPARRPRRGRRSGGRTSEGSPGRKGRTATSARTSISRRPPRCRVRGCPAPPVARRVRCWSRAR